MVILYKIVARNRVKRQWKLKGFLSATKVETDGKCQNKKKSKSLILRKSYENNFKNISFTKSSNVCANIATIHW